MRNLLDLLVLKTENGIDRLLTIKSQKRGEKKVIHPVLDWLGAFLWAIGFVLIINQFFLQAYVIPSRSMDETLVVGDRVLVDKFSYGPELIPGSLKLKGFREPSVGDVVIFENPEYNSRGALFDILQRFVFMLTLSMVDIDKDAEGNPSHHFLIKRVAASEHNYTKIDEGDLFVKSFEDRTYIPESEYLHSYNLDNYSSRIIHRDIYNEIDGLIQESVYINQNSKKSIYKGDMYFSNLTNFKYLSHISPSRVEYYQGFNRWNQGTYIPKDWMLLLGDNRDNSKDGRYFGLVHKSEILGRANMRFWPFNRVGQIKAGVSE